MPRRSKKKKVEKINIAIKCPVCRSVSLYNVNEIGEVVKCKKCGAELSLQPKDPLLAVQVQIIDILKDLLRKITDQL